jgi:hypothetical protein
MALLIVVFAGEPNSHSSVNAAFESLDRAPGFSQDVAYMADREPGVPARQDARDARPSTV